MNPTDAAIARRVNVKRETITRWRRYHPRLWRWLYECIPAAALERKPSSTDA